MVKTKSTLDYNKYKQEVYEEVNARYGEFYAKKILEFISDRYDFAQRVFLDKNFMVVLRDDYASIHNGDIQAYLIVGLGNVGKTTLAKNIAYFMDKEFRNNMLSWGIGELIDKINKTIEETCRAYVCDEPSDVPHPQSEKGKIMREIFGQMRQQKPVLIFCSTDLKDVPSTIMRKITTIIYLDRQGHGFVLKDRPELGEYPMHDIKKSYDREGYKAVSLAIEKYYTLQIVTHEANVLKIIDKEGEKKYLKDKKSELKKSLDKFNYTAEKIHKVKSLHPDLREKRNEKIKKLFEVDKKSAVEISRQMDMSRSEIYYVLKKQDKIVI